MKKWAKMGFGLICSQNELVSEKKWAFFMSTQNELVSGKNGFSFDASKRTIL